MNEDLGLTSVHPTDLTYHGSVADPLPDVLQDMELCLAFRHSGWLNDRRRVFDALREIGPGSKRVERFRHCGAGAWICYNEEDPEAFCVTSDHCHDRFCRPCSRFKASVVAGNLAAFLDGRPYRFLTLTVRNVDLSLKEAIDKLYRAFGTLRRSPLWRRCVTGGCAVCEVKPSSGGTRWHPHLHCVIEGQYMHQPVLRELWHEITGDSFIVDIRVGRDSDDAARYCAKYIQKPFDDDTIRRPPRLVEAIEALTGRRVITTFGSWRGVKLTVYEPAGTWVKLELLSTVVRQAKRGDADACALLAKLSALPILSMLPTPEPRPPPKPADPFLFTKPFHAPLQGAFRH